MRKLLLVLCAILMSALLIGCIEPSVRESVVSILPDKLIYIAGEDTELDLAGGEMTLFMESFFRPDSIEIHSMDGEFILRRLHHNIDFSTPRVYVVEIYLGSPGKQASFEIQVVTQEEYDAMMGPAE
jgi:hypothetical protein